MKQEVVLLSRRAAGYGKDRYVFLYRDKKTVKFYGDRLTDAQAKSLFLIEEAKHEAVEHNPEARKPQ